MELATHWFCWWGKTWLLIGWGICATITTAAVAGQAHPAQGVAVVRRRSDGLATFVTVSRASVLANAADVSTVADRPIQFLQAQGNLFGISDPTKQLDIDPARTRLDRFGFAHTTYRQVYGQLPVFSGMVKVHQRPDGGVMAANGNFYPISDKFVTIPAVTVDDAIAKAAAALNLGSLYLDRSELVIVDPGWYGDRPTGARLAYYLILSDANVPLREAFFVDAGSGEVLDQWSALSTVKTRRVYEASGLSLPGELVRKEGDPPVSFPVDVNEAYDYAGDTYDLFARAFGRDGIDDQMGILTLTVFDRMLNCPNAAWDGSQTIFCPGTTADDVIAHEITHGITQFTADLIYQNQSGQLNEAYSDIFGEVVDLFNGDASEPDQSLPPFWPKDADYLSAGTDTPNTIRAMLTCSDQSNNFRDGVRWLIAEDAGVFGGAIRDMWNPSCKGDPGFANSTLQTCNPGDNGGVHSGSGVANHAFALLSDGGVYRGYLVRGIGVTKAAAVWYRALTTYLTPASDFADAFAALNQAATDLVGTFPLDPRTGDPIESAFSADDMFQVERSLRAVDMHTEGRCGATTGILNPDPPPSRCRVRDTIYRNDFESGADGWTVSLSSPPPPTPYDWVLTSGLPLQRAGTAWFCDDPDIGDCSADNETATHSLISPPIALPQILKSATLSFTHYMASESLFDGGNVSIKVDNTPWQLISGSSFFYNAYNARISDNSSSTLSNQEAFTGFGGGWGTSLVDLGEFVSGGETIQFRFDFGKDGCGGVQGWYMDDFAVFACGCAAALDCDDGFYCNGVEACVDGRCAPGARPCGSDYCQESTHACVAAAFWDDFESSSGVVWEAPSPDSSATDGHWLIANPRGISTAAGEVSQPEDAFQGQRCALTGQNTFLKRGDVDGGVTYLVSPPIDLTGVYSAELSYERWFFDSSLLADPAVFFRAEVSEDDGVHWLALESLDGTVAANQWTARTYQLKDFIGLSDTVRLRFSASDNADVNHTVEAAIDNVVVKTTGNCLFDSDCDDGMACTVDFCASGMCVVFGVNCPTIVATDPPDGAIDAGQPHGLSNALVRQGWDTLEISLDAAAAMPPAPNDFELQEVGGDGVPPSIAQVTVTGAASFVVTLSEPLEAGTWTVVRYLPSGQQVCLGYLPGDVDGNGSTNTSDILALVDSLNGVVGRSRPRFATDMDRSGGSTPSDLTRLIDLLNGAGTLQPWLNVTLPPNPCP